jgi:hypothetical protein
MAQPGYVGSFIRSHPHANAGDEAVPVSEHLPGLFGLVRIGPLTPN